MKEKISQKILAEKFLKLHHDKNILLLPNAWDVVTAKIYENLGFKALGTTSAGIAATLGYPDGQKMSLEENLSVVKRIIEHTNLPVSADIEAGYSDSVEGAVEAAREALEIGAVGINLEDSTGSETKPFFEISEMVYRINAIRNMAEKIGIHLFINIRTDVFMLGKEELPEKLRLTIERAKIYKEAGADCIFIPDIGDFNEHIITGLVKKINAPLNIIAGENIPSAQKLEEIGVARLSFGPRPMRALLALLVKMEKELLERGTYEMMSMDTLSYEEVNNMFRVK